VVALVLFGSMPRSAANLRWIVRGLAAGIYVVCIAGLATRVLPDVFPIAATLADGRLSYPITYWNSLGLLAAVGAILSVHLGSSRGEPPVVRVLGAAAVPVFVTTLFFTFSRGAIAAGIVCLAIYLVLGRPSALFSGLLASIPTSVISVAFAYHADLLATANPTTAAATSQGHDVAVALVLCVAAAAGLRVGLLRFDSRMPRLSFPGRASPIESGMAAAGLVLTLLVAVLVFDVPASIAHQYDRFVSGNPAGSAADFRTRLTNPANNGRIDEWRVAYDAFKEKRLKGNGAGTYQNLWALHRPIALSVRDGHSLYVEVLGELGAIGLAFLLIAIGTILVTICKRARGQNRALYAAVFAVSLTWAIHAGADWDWEMPGVTIWVFALGGAAVAASRRAAQPARQPRPAIRVAAVVACFGVAIVPGLVLVSQSRLDDSADAFEGGNCPAAISSASSSISILGVRSEPYEVRGFCRLRQGRDTEAVSDFEKAVVQDPKNWVYHYDLAVARGAAGLDPRAEAAEAHRLNPLGIEARQPERLFRTGTPGTWGRQARTLWRGASPFYLSTR
jgi:O-antigen ligase